MGAMTSWCSQTHTPPRSQPPPVLLAAICALLLPLQLIEKLYRARWTKLDGLGALVLTPTRELALQIFEELVKVRFKGLLMGLLGRALGWHL